MKQKETNLNQRVEYSFHCFLFPFQWKKRIDQGDSLFPVDDFAKLLQVDNRWERSVLEFEDHIDYNEFAYFHPFAQDALYDYGLDDTAIQYYQFKGIERGKSKYKITLSAIKGERVKCKYILDIQTISLNLYPTGIGILSFHLSNYDYAESKDILLINDYGRRTYPVFLGDGGDVKPAMNTFLAESIQLIGLKDDIKGTKYLEQFVESYTEFDTRKKYPKQFILLPKFISALYPKELHDTFQMASVTDDRMFVLCWYGNNQIVSALNGVPQAAETNESGQLIHTAKEKYDFIDGDRSDFWYKFLFVDSPTANGVANKVFKENLLERHTYTRWVEYGTLLGVSRYSFVMLTNDYPTLKSFNADFLPSHMKSMYLKIAELCILQRASILNFSQYLTQIKKLNKDAKKAKQLYDAYLTFISKLHFREVTTQEQGIELYNMLYDCMQIGTEAKMLEKEIANLFQYLTFEEEYKRSEQLRQLTIVGASFVIPTIMTGYLGMNIFDTEMQPFNNFFYFLFLLFLIAIPILIWKYQKRIVFDKSFTSPILLAYALGILLPALICFFPDNRIKKKNEIILSNSSIPITIDSSSQLLKELHSLKDALSNLKNSSNEQ